MASGVALGYYWSFPWQYGVVTVGIWGLGIMTLEWSHRQQLNPAIRRLLIVGYLLGPVIFGSFWYNWYNRNRPQESSTHLGLYKWEELDFYGKVYDILPRSQTKWHVDIAVDSLKLPSGMIWKRSFNLRVVAYPEEVEGLKAPSSIHLGEYWAFTGLLYPLEAPTNPNEFDYKGYLASQNIYHHAGLKRLISKRGDIEILSWLTLRKEVLSIIYHQYDGETRALAKALLIGEKSGLDRDVKQAFSRSGLSHIMAVSGLHVGFLVMPIWFLMPWFWNRRSGKILILILMGSLLLLYAGITQFSASVSRAGIMVMLLAYARLYHKSHQSLNLMAFAALVLLFINPNRLFDIGFQLSFGAVTSIILLWPLVLKILPRKWQYRWYGTLVGIVGVSLVVQIGLFPLLVSYFGEFSLIGPLLNALVVPLLSVALPVALLSIPLQLLFPPLAYVPVYLFSGFLTGLEYLVSFSEGVPHSWLAYYPQYPLLLGLIWISAIITTALWWHRLVRWKWLGTVLLLLVILQGVHLWGKLQPGKLKLVIFDIGQGDASLITTPNGSHLLIDTGPWQPNYVAASSAILPYLKRNNIKKLDGVVLTHPHADHIGGVLEIMESVRVDTVYNSGAAYNSNLYKKYHRLAEVRSIPIKSLRRGDRIGMDPSVAFNVLSPDGTKQIRNVNNASIVLLASYGEMDFLFTGDIEQEVEQHLVAQYDSLLNIEFLKAAHHGSSTSNSTRFLDFATPERVAVSVAYKNKFSHPSPSISRRLSKLGADVSFTSINGALRYESDGQSIRRVESPK